MYSRSRMMLLSIVVSILLFVVAEPAHGWWFEDGIPICTEVSEQTAQCMAEIGPGLVVVVWHDYRGSDADIYAQLLDTWGNTYWAPDGVVVCSEVGGQIYPTVISDGETGVIVVWRDGRSGNEDIYAQRLDIDGNRVWATSGVVICDHSSEQYSPVAVPDGAGGAIIAWQDERYGASDADIFVQRINGSGSIVWYSGGVNTCAASGNQVSPVIITDGAGGAIVAWKDGRSGPTADIYAQRVEPLYGNPLWTPNGEVVTAATNEQQGVVITSDGAGGAIIAWQDYRSLSTYDIYAQRMQYDGSALWTANGEAICTESNDQFISDIVADENGGAVIIWSDWRYGNADVYADRVSRNGVSMWPGNGVAVKVGDGNQWAAGAIPDGASGAIVGWHDDQYGDYDAYVGRINYSGGVTTYQTNICDQAGDQYFIELISDGMGGVICSWCDERYGYLKDIFAQRVEFNGFWGYPSPTMLEVADVPDDQGGHVLLTWVRSRLDSPMDSYGIEYYSIWRLLGLPMMQALLDAGVKDTPPEKIGPEFEGNAYRFIDVNGEAFGYEWIANVDAHNLDVYSYAAPTHMDSSAAGSGLHTFFVSAHYREHVDQFWDSFPLEGYSVDNLAPCMPLALSGEPSFSPAGLELTWSPNGEADLAGYNIYRGVGPGFEPGPGNLIDTTCDTLLLDGGWTWGAGYCYKVAAVDIHGNESEYAALNDEQITGDDPMPVPDVTFLDQNFPNPFNPVTTIAFGLKEAGHVSLRIFDAGGRSVATLVDESRTAGTYRIDWRGLGGDGTAVASGVYFYMLQTKEFKETKKMILLR